MALEEHPQTLNAITKGKRGINTPLALKIERELELEEGTLVLLQAFYEIQKAKEQETRPTPDLSVLNKALYWDTDINKIDWDRQYRAVIQRVFERGSEADKEEITHFYGTDKINQALEESKIRKPSTIYKP